VETRWISAAVANCATRFEFGSYRKFSAEANMTFETE
jgi:hypothetical protein